MIYCARRRVSEANRRAAAALRPEIPPVEPCAAVGSPGQYGIGPYRRQGNAHSRPRAFAMPQACGTMRASSPTVSTAFSFAASPGCWRRCGVRRDEGIPPYGRLFGHRHPVWPGAGNLFVGAGFTAPAGAFRRPTAAQRRLLGRRSRPWNLAPPSGPRADMESAPTGGKAMPTAARGRLPCRRLAGRCEHRPLQSQRHFRLRPHRGVCGGAGCGGMRASRPTDACLVTGIPFGPKQKIYS